MPARGAPARLRSFVLGALVPDINVLWVPFAIARARRLGSRRFTALLSAGPPHSTHLAALALRGRAERWVVDAHDPWADNPFPVRRPRPLDALDAWLERSVISRADAIVSPTAGQSRAFQARYGKSARFVTLPSGYDERDFSGLTPVRPALQRLTHLGSLYGPRSPRSFLEALRSLATLEPNLVANWEVLFIGYADSEARAVLARAATDPLIGGAVRYVPHVERREALRIALGSDALLLITDPGGGGTDLVPIKTFEYLRARRPILALVPAGETARLLARTGGTANAPPDDPTAIRLALARIMRDPGAVGVPDRAAVGAFDFGHTLDALADELLGRGSPAGTLV
jgi:hypothetical protein